MTAETYAQQSRGNHATMIPLIPFQITADEQERIFEAVMPRLLTPARVRAIRAYLSMTQLQLAELLGVSQSFISKAECGTGTLSRAVAEKLLSLLGWNGGNGDSPFQVIREEHHEDA